MNTKTRFIVICLVGISLFANSTSFSRASVEVNGQKHLNNFSSASSDPAYQIVGHRIGRIELGLINSGSFGNGFVGDVNIGAQDAFTGEPVASCEYPKASNLDYLFAGAFWIGAIVGRDTLVSTGADGWQSGFNEFAPESIDFGGGIKKRSILYADLNLDGSAKSEEDYIMVYSDTSTVGISLDQQSNKPHTPLHVEVTQKSYAWSYPYADDFILFDYEIKNIGENDLEKVYMGIYVDADVGSLTLGGNTYSQDDLSGFIETFQVFPFGDESCEYTDTVNIAWTADNDGDPVGGSFNEDSPRAVTGTRIIRTPGTVLDVSYNWWAGAGGDLDYGPRERSGVGRLKEEFRDLGTGALGTPEGDANKYYFMRNREFDFDQYRIKTVGHDPDYPEDSLWLPPDQLLANTWATGVDTRYLLSFGPFNINPGERLPLSFAYVAGNNFHSDPNNLINNLPDNPSEYYKNLNFDSLALNASWAARVYDNPGRDTYGDTDSGNAWICCSDSTWMIDTTFDTTAVTPQIIIDTTVNEYWGYDPNDCEKYWYQGDGDPDFEGASPPPAPVFWLTPDVGSMHIRFNGLYSETTKDVFSRIIDFEGYRVYFSRDERESSYSLISSMDLEDYNRYVLDTSKSPAVYILKEKPFTLDEIRCLYGDSCNDLSFDPNNYPRENPITKTLLDTLPDNTIITKRETFYFAPQDYNSVSSGFSQPITKIYPDQSYPTNLIPDSANPLELTEDGYLKYFEYETTVDNLLPTVPYYFNVTAFDFGSPESGLTALESSKALNAQISYANSRGDENLASNKKVYTYPNPYRLDGEYQDLGFETKPPDQSSAAEDRIRAIHFANLPPKCTIKIFTLDGDLVQEIDHDIDPLDPTSGHQRWDLITRNTQLTVTGLYYWTVEADGQETQIGKLVIIM